MSSLPGGILFLDLAVFGNQVEGLGLGLEDGVAVAAKDHNNVKVLKTLMGFFEGNLRTNNDTSTGENLGLSSSNGNLEGLCGCTLDRDQYTVFLIADMILFTGDTYKHPQSCGGLWSQPPEDQQSP